MFQDGESQIAAGQKLNFESVSVSDLIMISGISDAIAQQIVKLRDKRRPKTAQELKKLLLGVHGIGEKKASELERALQAGTGVFS